MKIYDSANVSFATTAQNTAWTFKLDKKIWDRSRRWFIYHVLLLLFKFLKMKAITID